MPARINESEKSLEAERLARALRSGLELRWSVLGPPLQSRHPFPPRGSVRPFLEPYANSLLFHLPRRPFPFHRLVRAMRFLVRKLIAPWLDLQSHFNLSTVSVVEQVEQRVKELEETEKVLRQSIEKLEKAVFDPLDSEQSRLIDILDEGSQRHVNGERTDRGRIAQVRAVSHSRMRAWLDRNDSHAAGVNQRILEHIFVHTHLPKPPACLLDLGCSKSTNAIEMSSLGFEVVGVDSRKLPLNHPNFTLIQANAADLPFDDESFDGAVALSSLEHIGPGWHNGAKGGSSDEQVIAEVFRVLKPRGRFLLTMPFGRRAISAARRIYDRRQLDRLLAAFNIIERGYGIHEGGAWSFRLDEPLPKSDDDSVYLSAVCLLVLEKT